MIWDKNLGWPVAKPLWIRPCKNAVSLQYLKKELSYEVDVLHADKYKSILQVDSIIFDGFGQASSKYPGKFAISLWHLKKEVRKNEVRDFTALAGWNATLTIYYTSNVLPPLTLFLSHCWIYTKPFLHLIVCVTFLLFQVTVAPCRLACFFELLRINLYWNFFIHVFWRYVTKK